MAKNIRYWRISPGQGGFLWREQKLNDCIAIGWSDVGNAKLVSKKKILANKQLATFVYDVKKGDKIVASTSGRGVYALGTVIGDYKFNNDLEYKQSRKVRWETTFWHPLEIKLLNLHGDLKNKFIGRSSRTIREMDEKEWNLFCNRLNKIYTPFRNLGSWGSLIQSPEYENEVIILFSQMAQYLNMRVVSFGTRFPDAIVERKKRGKWKRVDVEFELYSSGFQDHLKYYEGKNCYTIVCWEDDNWNDNRKKRPFEIIELKRELEKIL